MFSLAPDQATVAFVAILAPTYAPKIDLQKFAQWLGTQGLRGGHAGNAIQGGGAALPEGLREKMIGALSAK